MFDYLDNFDIRCHSNHTKLNRHKGDKRAQKRYIADRDYLLNVVSGYL